MGFRFRLASESYTLRRISQVEVEQGGGDEEEDMRGSNSYKTLEQKRRVYLITEWLLLAILQVIMAVLLKSL